MADDTILYIRYLNSCLPLLLKQAAKAAVLAHFVEEKGTTKLLLVFLNEATWNLWKQVFDEWEARNLISKDGYVMPLCLELFLKLV